MLSVAPGTMVTPAVLLIAPPVQVKLPKLTGPEPPIDPALNVVFPVTVEAFVPLKFTAPPLMIVLFAAIVLPPLTLTVAPLKTTLPLPLTIDPAFRLYVPP